MKTEAYKIEEKTIILNRELTELDKFVRKFLDVAKKYGDYLVVSGFVSISTGRIRGTEDVDILMEQMNELKFKEFFDDLAKNKFWCYQSDNAKEAFGYMLRFENIRFAREGEMFPNIELIPINETRKAKYFEFTHPQKIRVKDFEFKIPEIEFEICYKEIMLAGKKDKEDAAHLRVMFSEILDNKKLNEYKKIVILKDGAKN